MSLPEPGDLNWGAPLNDAIEAALSDAADARADASSARDTAIDARMTADAVRDFVVAPADEQVASLVADDDAEAAGAVDTRIDTKVDPIRDLSDPTFATNLSASYVVFRDQNGDPLPPGSVTTITVNTVTGEIDDITFQEA